MFAQRRLPSLLLRSRSPLFHLPRRILLHCPRTMATLSIAPTDKALSLLVDSFPSLSIAVDSPTPAPTTSQLKLDDASTVAGTNTIASHLASEIPAFKKIEYSDIEQAEISQWLTLSAESPVSDSTLDKLNDNLKFRTTLLGEKVSVADVVVYVRVKDMVAGWSDEQRSGENGRRHIVRWVDYVQNTPDLGLKIKEEDKVQVDPSKVLHHPKPEEGPKKEKKPAAGKVEEVAGKAKETVKEAGKKGKDAVKQAAGAAAGAAQGQKKEKKEKQKRPAPPPKAEPVISPAQLDLRVGHILHCRPHPNADSLFVSCISMGDAPDAPVVTPFAELQAVLPAEVIAAHQPFPPCRTVCSGLNGLIPIEEMQNRKVVTVANLKPVTMRGIKSAAMVLAASPPPPADADPNAPHKKELVELVAPPADGEAGDKVFFEGYEGEPEAQLNPKKKIWEQIQPGFKTTDELEVAFDRQKAGWDTEEGEKGKAKADQLVGKLVVKGKGVCTVVSVKGGNVS